MKLTCPSCAAVHSAEAWTTDSLVRQFIKVVAEELPADVGRRALQYLALFRPHSGRGLRWDKALRLAGELQDLVGDPEIQWKGKPVRPNSATAWALAMERMIENRPKQLPLTSHNYLRAIAYEIANEMDRKKEYKPVERQQRQNMETPEKLDLSELKSIRNRNFPKRKQ